MTYDFGLRFKLGASAQSPQEIIKRKEEADAAAQRAILYKQQTDYDAKIDSLNQQMEKSTADQQDILRKQQADYDAKIDALNQQLKKAYAKGNVEEAVELIQEKKQIEAIPQEKVALSGKELEALIIEIMEKMNKPQRNETRGYYSDYYKGTNNIYERIDMLERLFLQMNYMPQAPAVYQQPVYPNSVNQQILNQQNVNQQILKTLDELNKQLKRNNELLEQK